MTFLLNRAVKIFGKGGTPLALNCLFSLQYEKVKIKVRPKGGKKYRYEHSRSWTVPNISTKLGIKNNYIDCRREERHKLPIKAIMVCIQKYGSVEGLYKDREKKYR